MTGHGPRFRIEKSMKLSAKPASRWALFAANANGLPIASGMTKANADDVAGALARMVPSTPQDVAGANLVAEAMLLAQRGRASETRGTDCAAFTMDAVDGYRYIVQVRVLDRAEVTPFSVGSDPPPSRPHWEAITEDVRRMEVPAGWLYQAASPSGFGPLTFVRRPVDKR